MIFTERRTVRAGLSFSHRIMEHPAPTFAPVLFVSGAFQTMDSWGRFARAFAPHSTVLLVDPPGMGSSDLLPSEYGIDFLAGCLEQVLEENGIERANVIAASYGTPAALRLAELHPERVHRIVLAGTMRALPEHLRARIAGTIALARCGDREGLASECVDGMLCNEADREIDRRGYAARVLRGGIMRMSDAELVKYAANTERLLHHPPLDLTGRITGPEALAFTGEHDVFTYPAACREVATAFARARFTTIRRADHLFHLQQCDAVVELLLRFVGGRLGAEATDGWSAVEPAGRASRPIRSPRLVASALP